MWRLWHALFGWHYATIVTMGDGYVRRVYRDGDGMPYCKVWGMHFDLAQVEGSKKALWFPLTFPRSWVTQPDRLWG